MYLRNHKDTEREINPFPASAERAFVCLVFRLRRFRGLLQHMTRSYEAADESHLEQRSAFAIVLPFQKISALPKLNLLLFGGLFCSPRCIPCFNAAHLPRHWVQVRFHHHQHSIKMSAAAGWRGLPVFQAQVTRVAPTAALVPATDKFRGQSLGLSLWLAEWARFASSSHVSRERASAASRNTGLSRTDRETKPVGALWIIAGFTTAENSSEPLAAMPCHPCAASCRASRGRQSPSSPGSVSAPREVGAWRGCAWAGLGDLGCPCGG